MNRREMPAAIQNDQVVAGMVIDPFTTRTVQAGKGTMLVDLGTARGSQVLYGSEYAMSGLMTRQDVVQDKTVVLSPHVAGGSIDRMTIELLDLLDFGYSVAGSAQLP